MRTLDLTAVEAVENQMKKHLEPIVATQQLVQSIMDAQQPMLRVVAESLEGFAQAAKAAQDAMLPRVEIIDTFSKMQELVDATKISFDIPQLPPMPAIEFGEMCVEVMEDEEEMIPLFVPDRRVTAEDRHLIAREVVQILKEENLVIAGKQQKPKLLGGTTIQKITMVRPRGRGRFRIVVNEDYANPLSMRFAKCWQELSLIADKAEFTIHQVKSTFGYFNTNVRCALYTQTSYQKTQILQIVDGVVTPKIDIEIISEKALVTRLNKVT